MPVSHATLSDYTIISVLQNYIADNVLYRGKDKYNCPGNHERLWTAERWLELGTITKRNVLSDFLK